MKILVVDDDQGLRQALTVLLSGEGYEVLAEGDPVRALERAGTESPDMILCDVRMPTMSGLEFLNRYQAGGGPALVIMMSAYGGEEAAIAALKAGAYDYLLKPFRSDEVVLTLRKAEERERLREQVASLEAELARSRDRDLVAESPAMRQVVELATRVARYPTTVLLTGESGTGKEVLARAIHRLSPRRERRFVAVNCGAIPENLLESELFGHVRGAFTGASANRAGLFEEASGGTLLLDEIGDLPTALQVKLLRVVQEGEIRAVGDSRGRKVDVRLIAATARDMEADVAAGRFREDLYYRLNVVRIHLPPLRDRPEDLDGLVTRLVTRAAARTGRKLTLTPAALEAVRAYHWPGNVRELENALERAAVLSPDGIIHADAFGSLRTAAPSPAEGSVPPMRLADVVAEAERAAVARALEAASGNRAQAARALGVSVRSLFYRLKRFDK